MFYTVNVQTGDRTLIKQLTGASSGSTSINAIGYNALDYNLYAIQANVNPPKVIKIGAQGQEVDVFQLPVSLGTLLGVTSYNVGDVDENGVYWISNAGRAWAQIDIANQRIISQGIAVLTNAVYDWAYVPGGGNYLYAVNTDSSGNAFLFRFDRSAHTWAQVGKGYGNLFGAAGTLGAAYAERDGSLYVSDNTSGKIYKCSLNGVTATFVKTGPTASANDGAHCILNGSA